MVLNESDIKAVKTFISDELRKTFELQGHKMTGSLIDKLEWVVNETPDSIIMQLYMLMYGVYLDTGTPKEKIPYSLPSGRGGKSKYITALINYVEKRMGLPEKKAKSVAFAIAATHLKDGMPTRASSRFSKTGNRTEFFSRTLKENIIERKINQTFQHIFFSRFENRINGLVRKFNTQ
jgi:hypothetical protein